MAFSAALCRGLIEAPSAGSAHEEIREFSAALCRGLIEANQSCETVHPRVGGFPRLYAAASLKRYDKRGTKRDARRFPRLYAAASLKHYDP